MYTIYTIQYSVYNTMYTTQQSRVRKSYMKVKTHNNTRTPYKTKRYTRHVQLIDKLYR